MNRVLWSMKILNLILDSKKPKLAIANYILGFIFRIIFIFCALIFHPIQWIAYNLIGENAQQNTVIWMNGILTKAIGFCGNKLKYTNRYEVPADRPIVFAANHQSMWDIVGIYWYLRKYRPVFVSKVELKKGLPSISYNLRKSGAAFVDLKDKKTTIKEILTLSQKIQKERRAAVIFPEGRRSRDGVLKDFAAGGLIALLKKAPDALVVPIAIDGTGAITAKKYKINAFKQVSWTVLEPIDPKKMDGEALANRIKAMIAQELGQL